MISIRNYRGCEGFDLLETTAQQRQICLALGGTPPAWAHIPVVLNNQGQKLSKQNHAPALDDRQPGLNLWRALNILGQQPPTALATADPQTVLDWALENWSMTDIPQRSTCDTAAVSRRESDLTAVPRRGITPKSTARINTRCISIAWFFFWFWLFTSFHPISWTGGFHQAMPGIPLPALEQPDRRRRLAGMATGPQ